MPTATKSRLSAIELKDMHERRAALGDELRAVIDRNGGCEITDKKEVEIFNRLSSKFDELTNELDAVVEIPAVRAKLDEIRRRPMPGKRTNQMPSTTSDIGLVDQDGRSVQALSSDEPFLQTEELEDGFFDREPHAVGRIIKAGLTSDFSGLNPSEVRAAQFGSGQTEGGYQVDSTLSGMFIDIARSASVVVRSGAKTIPMKTSELRIGRLDSDPSASWTPELGDVTNSSGKFGLYLLRAKSLKALIPLSIEWLEDSSNGAAVIENAIRQVMARELDKAILIGSGASEPLGLSGTLNVNKISAIGLPTDYAETSSAVTKIQESNYSGKVSGLSWIQHPTISGIYDSLVSATDLQPLRMTPATAQLQQRTTTSLPTSTAIIGDFSQCLIGIRKNVTIRRLHSAVSTDAASVELNSAKQFAVTLAIYLRIDAIALRPSHFTILEGITTS